MVDSAPEQKTRILFVDDEEKVVEGLRRMLRRYRKSWDMTFVVTPEEALRLAQEAPFDVVISDMRMPGMNGSELLERIRDISPQSVRIILSGQSEVSAIMKSVGPSHQFLAKPCDGEQIEAAISKASRLQRRLNNKVLLETVGRIDTLPSLPAVYTDVISAIRNEASFQDIGAIISRDIAMTAKILQLVNSSYFGLPREVNDPERAAMFLGTETLQGLILGAGIFDKMEDPALEGVGIEDLWARSGTAAAYARVICNAEGADQVVLSQAVTGALVHDIGILILATHHSEGYAEALDKEQTEGMLRQDAERSVIGVTHSDAGAYLVGLWSFPNDLVEAVAYHHSPCESSQTGFASVAAVHVGQALAYADLKDETGDSELPPGLDLEFIDKIGMSERLPVWIEECRSVGRDE